MVRLAGRVKLPADRERHNPVLAHSLAPSPSGSTLPPVQLDPALAKTLNAQINLEFSSAYTYLGMAVYFEHSGLPGFGAWMRLQGQEELAHASKFLDYVLDRGGQVELAAIPAPVTTYSSPLAACEASLASERRVSAAICDIYEQAVQVRDYPTLSFLKWFLDEQVEEEKTATEMIAKLKLAGTAPGALFQLDREAGSRAAAK